MEFSEPERPPLDLLPAPAGAPALPAYGGPCLDGIVPGLLAVPGARPAWFPEPAQRAAQAVLVLVDGLGWRQLQARLTLSPTLAAMDGQRITSVVPTTTATALTSLAVGCAPAVHGIVGYKVRVETPDGEDVLNVLRWRTASGSAADFLDPAVFQPHPPFGGRPVPVISKTDFAGTGFSLAHLRGSQPADWVTASGIAVEVGRQLRDGAPLVYVYYEGLDKVAHAKGFGPYYDAELAAVDRLVADIAAVLPPGVALVVTADHGQVDTSGGDRPLDADLLSEVRLCSGEPRFRWLHAPKGASAAAVADLAEEARRRYGPLAWIRSASEAIEEGWFGGPLRPEVRDRLGDVALVAAGSTAFLDPDQDGVPLVCRHGSLTADEMEVPLLAWLSGS